MAVAGWLRWRWWRGGGTTPTPPAKVVWLARPGGRAWLAPGGLRTWALAATTRYWLPGDDMGLASNTIEEEAGFSGLSLGMDFGDLPEVGAGAAVASCTVTVPTGLTVTGAAVESNGYRVSALFASSTPGTYAVKFTATLDTTPAAVVVRTGTLTVL